MRSLSLFLACIGALSLFTMGCERHEFESTKKLHLEHGGGHHKGDDHKGDDHKGEKHEEKVHDSKGGRKEEKKSAKPEKEEARDTGI